MFQFGGLTIWLSGYKVAEEEEGRKEGREPRDLGRFRFATHRLLTCNLELNVGGATEPHTGAEGRGGAGSHIQSNSDLTIDIRLLEPNGKQNAL